MAVSLRSPSRSSNGPPVVGKIVPDFSAESFPLDPFQLSDMAGKCVVLYFYPKDDTPGCTLEGQDFSRLKPQFAKLNTVVYGIERSTFIIGPDQKLVAEFRKVKAEGHAATILKYLREQAAESI